MRKTAREFVDEIWKTQDLQDISDFNISLDSAVHMMEEYANQRDGENSVLQHVSGSLPNDINLSALANLLKYTDKYEISIQFWPDQTAVFIAKDGVDLKDFGGDFDYVINESINYLERIQNNDH